MPPREQERRRWHFKRELSLGDLIAVAGAALLVLSSYHTLDKRLSAVEKDASAQKVVDTRQDEEALRNQARVEAAMQQINLKLDRLIERGATR